MLIKDFIEHIIKFDDVDTLLDTYESQSEKGFIYERLWDIIIKFGFCNTFKQTEYTHIIGNVNGGKVKELKSFTNYLNTKVKSGNSGGCSDITLKNKSDDTYIFISSKYPKNATDITKQKSVDYYDISNIVSIINHNTNIYKNFKIYLLVTDKNSFLEKVKNANSSSKHITKYMSEVFDKYDLNKYFLAFKTYFISLLEKGENINYDEEFLSSKERLEPRFHQQLVKSNTLNLWKKGERNFLWACKCRSG